MRRPRKSSTCCASCPSAPPPCLAASRNPTLPATMSSPDAIRDGVAASPSTMIPRMKTPTAPIPAQIVWAVRSGSSFRAGDNSQTRAIIATMAMAEPTGLEKPSEILHRYARTTWRSPAAPRNNQAMTARHQMSRRPECRTRPGRGILSRGGMGQALAGIKRDPLSFRRIGLSLRHVRVE